MELGIVELEPDALDVGQLVIAVDAMTGQTRVGRITALREEVNGFRTITVTPPDGDEPPRDFLVAPTGQPQMTHIFVRAQEDDEPAGILPPGEPMENDEPLPQGSDDEPPAFSPRAARAVSPGRGPSNPPSAAPTPQRPSRAGLRKQTRRRRVVRRLVRTRTARLLR